MNEACGQFEQLVATAASGNFDALTPEQVVALEGHLNACAHCAARLADHTPQPDAHLAPPIELPSEQQWNQVWETIEAAQTRAGPARPGIGGFQRLWRTVAAAAACLLLAALWRSATPSATAEWDLKLSDHVVVHEVETFGDVVSLVVYSDDDSAAVIWMLDDEGA